eukprot:TRINITY_DN1740_c0_g1_i1.p1 TRINITY_DN1740_c0_g1~~TRINITY_DN1740_c0_g1_i1.p1  ORF type:complete len:207 (-),score=57.79 TRINITY_DN1740_c0_g1_i1:3-623(-)
MQKVSVHQKNIRIALDKISHYQRVLNLSGKVGETAKTIYCDFEKSRQKGAHYATEDALIVAILKVAGNQEKDSRSLKDLSEQTDIDSLKLRQATSQLQKVLPNLEFGSARNADLIWKYGHKLKLGLSVIDKARQIGANKDFIERTEGKRPDTVSSTAIFIACKNDPSGRTVEEIAEVTKVSSATIKKTFQDIADIEASLLASIKVK